VLPEKILESLTCFQKTFWNILEHSGTPIWFPMVRSPNSGTSIDRAFDSSPCPTSHDEASYVHVHVPQQSSSLRDEIAGWAPNAVGWLGCSHARSRRNAEENAVCLRGSEGITLWHLVVHGLASCSCFVGVLSLFHIHFQFRRHLVACSLASCSCFVGILSLFHIRPHDCAVSGRQTLCNYMIHSVIYIRPHRSCAHSCAHSP